MGEGSLHPSLPAIANAVFDAVGVWVDELPLTGQALRRALQTQGDAKE